ncbi:hypothetical protein Clacol_003162 [Clathrus columnatus]|uniref:NADP-dependent oxidoreductase domain-containing protein n=1 Tax=Clathrus columnatus TaxID=1419009 RepID=A0AAV5A2T1_9AGAM|nr:hypothetical protein Clacol_003162 [Clathrus columnatus]
MATRKTTMPYVRLGNSGLKVSKIILGTMQYGDTRSAAWYLGEEEAIKHIKAAYDAGIQSFDTANVYSNGESERILGKAIKALNLPRDEIVVMTKVFNTVGREPGTSFFNATPGNGPDQTGYVNQHGLSRKHIFESVKHSLERLQLDYVDLLQCHRFDYETPIEETLNDYLYEKMQALHDVVQAGYSMQCKVRSHIEKKRKQHYKLKNDITDYAINNKLTPFISMQNHYSLIYREEEREMMPTLKHFGVGCIPWSPLARGLLTRPFSEQTKRGETDPVQEIAKKRGLTMAQVALAWCYAKPGMTAPIVGTTSLKNLEELIAAVNITLTNEEVKYLEEPYQPQAIAGHM